MWNKINYMSELCKMRKKYARKPMTRLGVERPLWLIGNDDALNEIYDNPASLFQNATIHYSCIVQANSLLFSQEDHHDCPATFITSDSEYVNANPDILRSLAQNIYQYKEVELDRVPGGMKKIVAYIQDEYDRSHFSTEIKFENGVTATIYVISMMVMRPYLPSGYLDKGIYPLLTNYGKCDTAMILPKEYWTSKAIKLL